MLSTADVSAEDWQVAVYGRVSTVAKRRPRRFMVDELLVRMVVQMVVQMVVRMVVQMVVRMVVGMVV